MRLIFPMMFAASLLGSSAPAVEIIAHRGASHDAPENTVASMRLAWEQGAPAGELDIRLTRDDRVILLHDADTKRTTGTPGVPAERTLDELRALDAGSWKGEKWRGEPIPTLEEALATMPDGRRMFIEIKCGAEVFPALERALKASGKRPEQLVLIAFNRALLTQAKQLFPQLKAYWVVGSEADKKTGKRPDQDELLAQARASGFDGLDLHHGFPLDAAYVARVHAAGLGLYVWTVNDPAIAARLVQAGVDGITTDRPGWLAEQLREKR